MPENKLHRTATHGRARHEGDAFNDAVASLCEGIITLVGPLSRLERPAQREPTIAELRATHEARQRRMAAEQARKDAAERERQEAAYQAWRRTQLRNTCH